MQTSVITYFTANAIKVTMQIIKEFFWIQNRNLKFMFLNQPISLSYVYICIDQNLTKLFFTFYKITITSVKLHKTFYVSPNPEPAGYSNFSSSTTKLFQSKRQTVRKQFDLCASYPKESHFQSMCWGQQTLKVRGGVLVIVKTYSALSLCQTLCWDINVN